MLVGGVITAGGGLLKLLDFARVMHRVATSVLLGLGLLFVIFGATTDEYIGIAILERVALKTGLAIDILSLAAGEISRSGYGIFRQRFNPPTFGKCGRRCLH